MARWPPLWLTAAWKKRWRCVERLTEIFGRDNVYVELQRHFHREQEARNRAAIEIARSLQLPLLATNGVCYATPRERELCDVFTALRHHRTLATAGRLLARNSERYLKSPQEMAALFADLPEAIANTVELSSRLEFTLKDLGYEFPKYPVPEGETMMSFLRERTREGFSSAMAGQPQTCKTRAQRQIERELETDRKACSRRLLPDRLGPGPLLPRAKHSGAGARLRRQQRRLLFAGHHRRRSRRHGTAFRALSFRRARRVARHRSRSSQRRPARARDSVFIQTLRRARRCHDRQRHHLSQPHGGARNGQGAGVRSGNAGQSFHRGFHLGISRRQRRARSSLSRCRTGSESSPPAQIFRTCVRRCRICRVISASIPAAW